MRSITSTRRVTSSGCGRGTTISVWPASRSTWATSSMFCASSRKSSSSAIVSAKSSTSAGGFASAATGIRPTRYGAIHAIAATSWRTSVATCGRCTLTTTSSPLRSVAACTCAIDADASGVASKRAKIVSSGAPQLRSTTCCTCAKDSGGTRSRQLLNSATSSSGKMPCPDDTICASLMYDEPSVLERDRAAAATGRRATPRVPRRFSKSHHAATARADQRARAHETPHRRQPAPAHPLGHLRLARDAQRVDAATPRQRLRIDVPAARGRRTRRCARSTRRRGRSVLGVVGVGSRCAETRTTRARCEPRAERRERSDRMPAPMPPRPPQRSRRRIARARSTRSSASTSTASSSAAASPGPASRAKPALRGLRVALLEARDFAAGTSSRSSKLIHGGLRYLAMGDVALVRDTALERKRVFALAPHLAERRWMLVPARSYAGLLEVPRRARHLREARRGRGSRIATATGTPRDLAREEPLLRRDRYPYACVYREYLTDDARLVLANLRDARARGAVALNHAPVTAIALEAGRAAGVDAKCAPAVAASGCARAASSTRRAPGSKRCGVSRRPDAPAWLHLSKGVHVGVPAARLPLRQIAILGTADKRSIFAIPRGDVVYLGTTDTSYGQGADRRAAGAARRRRVPARAAAALLRHRPAAPRRLRDRLGGPAPADRRSRASAPRSCRAATRSRSARAGSSRSRAASSPATARWASRCSHASAEVLGRPLAAARDEDAPLPGGDFDGNLEALAQRVERASGVDARAAARLVRLYGTEAERRDCARSRAARSGHRRARRRSGVGDRRRGRARRARRRVPPHAGCALRSRRAYARLRCRSRSAWPRGSAGAPRRPTSRRAPCANDSPPTWPSARRPDRDRRSRNAAPRTGRRRAQRRGDARRPCRDAWVLAELDDARARAARDCRSPSSSRRRPRGSSRALALCRVARRRRGADRRRARACAARSRPARTRRALDATTRRPAPPRQRGSARRVRRRHDRHRRRAARSKRTASRSDTGRSRSRSRSVGGWVATRASGQFSTAYGSIEDLVLALEVVLGRRLDRCARARRRAPRPVPICASSSSAAKARSAS